MFAEIRNLIIKWLLIPSFFLFFAFALSILYYINSDTKLNILSQNQVPINLQQSKYSIRGEFTSTENYLGILEAHLKVNENTKAKSIFRIKDKSDNTWYHTSTIDAINYRYTPTYRFGFPTIPKSKNKTYLFEITLLHKKGGEYSSISLDKDYPYITLQSEYKKTLLLSNKAILAELIREKIFYYTSSDGFWKVFAIYSIPLLLYLLYITSLSAIIPLSIRSKVVDYRAFLSKPYFMVLVSAVIFDIFVIRQYSDFTTILFILLWILGIITYKLRSDTSFYSTLLLLTLCPLLIFATVEPIAEKTAIWAYLLLIIGFFQAAYEANAQPDREPRPRFLKSIVGSMTHLPIYFDKYSEILIKAFLKLIRLRAEAIIKFIYRKSPSSLSDWVFLVAKTAMLIIVLLTLLIIFIMAFFLINNHIQAVNHKKDRIAKNPVIETIEPELVYKATKVVIYGKNFDWDVGKAEAFMDGEKIDILLWTDTKIVFLVPLHWKNGTHRIWIEKQIDWDGKITSAKSKTLNIKILPISEKFTESDRLYFEQLKNLKRETLKLNGYN